MPQSRLTAVLTALMLLSTSRAALAGFSFEQLVAIDGLVAARDYAGLKSFIETNPQVLLGNEPLANELRLFLLKVDTGQLTTFDSPFWNERAGNAGGNVPDFAGDDTTVPTVSPASPGPRPGSGPSLPY